MYTTAFKRMRFSTLFLILCGLLASSHCQILQCPEECTGFPICTEQEVGQCDKYTDDGCSTCSDTYFKKHWHYPCVSCKETFGDTCQTCGDFIGCQTCISDKYTRVYDYNCDLWYCREPTDKPTEYPTIDPTEEPTEFPSKFPSLEPTDPPTMKCTIQDTDLRLVFMDAYFNEIDSDNNYQNENNEWCYQYALKITSNNDSVVPGCQSNSTLIKWSLDFACDTDDNNALLTSYLESVFATSNIANYEVIGNVFYFELPRSAAEHNDMYTLCFNDDLVNNVGLFVESEYCVNVDLGKRRQGCANTIVADICGDSSLAGNSDISEEIAEYPISLVPIPGKEYDLDSDDDVNGTGTMMLSEDLIVPRVWWVKQCDKIDENTLQVVFDDNYIFDDENIFVVDDPIMIPIYDRIVGKYGCRDIQGVITDSYFDNDSQEYVVTIDTAVGEFVYFNESDFEIFDAKLLELNQLANNFQRNDGLETVKIFEELNICVVSETDEQYIIETEEDLEYISTVVEPAAEANGYTVLCFKESDSLETQIINNLPSDIDFTYEDFEESLTTGTLTGELSEQDNDFEDSSSTTSSISSRRLLTTSQIEQLEQLELFDVSGRRKLLAFIDKSGSKTIANLGFKVSESVSHSGASCNFAAEAGLKITIGFRLYYKIFGKKFEAWASIRGDGFAYANLFCSIPNNSMKIKLWEKKFGGSKITIFSVFGVPIHVQPSLTLVARLDLESPITWFNATARADAFAEFKIGFRDGKPFSEYKKDFKFVKVFDIDDENLDCNSVEIDASVVFEVNPGIEIGAAGVNIFGLTAILELPRLGVELDYPALDLCSAEDCGAIHRRLFGVINLYFHAYIPKIKLGGKTITNGVTLYSSANPVKTWTIFDTSKCITSGLLVDKLNEICCEDPTPEPTTPAPTTTTTVAPVTAPSDDGTTPSAPTTPAPSDSSSGGGGSDSSVCVDTCRHEPCKCYENPSCKQCKCDDSTGCDECIDGYFQLSKNHRCISCRETFGDECEQCTTGVGCSQCKTGYKVTYDESCGLFYCQAMC